MLLLHAMLLLAPRQAPNYPPNAVIPLSGTPIKGLPAVTGNIHVDQFGYRPSETKVAVLVDPQRGFNAGNPYVPGARIELRERKTGRVVLSGAAKPWRDGATHEDSGDRGWWFDFSSVKKTSDYYVFDPAAKLRSPVFTIRANVFSPILRAASRMYYYQRLGMPLKTPYAEAPWTEEAGLLQDAHARAVWDKDNPKLERDLSGGWMDAGDTDKYPPFNADVIHPLLYAYTANPKAFTDHFGIPESGNGRPDLLDEVKYQLDWLVKMQFEDGSLPVKMGNIDYGGKYPLSQDRRTRYYGPKDSGATIYTAANFAHAARVFGAFPAWKGFASDLKSRALRAWHWYQTHPRTFKSDTGEIKSGIANRSAEEQDRMELYAAIHLWAITGDGEFDRAIHAKLMTSKQISEGVWTPYETGVAESLVDYTKMKGADPAVVAKIRAKLALSARSALSAPLPEADLYRAWMNPEAYHWGSNFVRAAFGIVALLESDAGGVSAPEKARLRQRAADMLHSFHGMNPLGAVYLTNMGRYGAESSMTQLYHDRYGFNSPFAKNPPPGYVVGGPNQAFGGSDKSVDWVKSQPRAKAYADFCDGWPKNSWELSEPAIYYQAAYVRLIAAFAE